MTKEKLRISFCIVCMNRLHHLQHTLVRNLKDNEDYSDLEFIVLNYNSRDGMHEWMIGELQEYIVSGKIVYYHTEEPSVFSHSHSKNLAFKLATGDVLCSINADHFTGVGFASYVNSEFQKIERAVLTTIDYYKVIPDYSPPKDVYGKICVKRDDFYKVRGFDEEMVGYGFEDWDIVNRLEILGCQRVFIRNFEYLRYISHDQEERYILDFKNHLEFLYIRYITPYSSQLILFLKNGGFQMGTIVNNSAIDSHLCRYSYSPREYKFEYSLAEEAWIEGRWELNSEINLITDDGVILQLVHVNGLEELIDPLANHRFYLIENQDLIRTILDFDQIYSNRQLMEKNFEEKRIVVNPKSFGMAVYKKIKVEEAEF